ncbi:MAG: acyl transferase [Chitinophagaceae bacterium]|nr:acyl transferase [Chitinophagaceae bacterium]
MELHERVFAASASNFNDLALEVFRFQYQNNRLYRQYCDLLKVDAANLHLIEKIPFLPISFFKTHTVKTTAFETDTVFESSGTTGTINSKHYVKDISVYNQSLQACYEKFYGSPQNKCILGLLPSYLERKNSSLVNMTDSLIKKSGHALGGFYVHDHEKLHRTLIHNELLKIPTLLIGVTYALLDFAEQYPMQLRNTIVMETGGMKGKREEMTRSEVHARLQNRLGISLVHSEYGMTELLSQAYSKGDGIFHCPGWMKVLIREEQDPLQVISAKQSVAGPVSGAINMIDLANVYSCSFIATDDVGRLYKNDSFEVLGRLDSADIRGCSLMLV